MCWQSRSRATFHETIPPRWSQLSAEQELSRRRIFQMTAEGLLQRERRCPYEESIRLRLHKQRDHLFTFLQYEGVDPTNNLAERQLRPAVISRKLSCGNKSLHCARTWEILNNLAVTARINGRQLYDLLSAAYARKTDTVPAAPMNPPSRKNGLTKVTPNPKNRSANYPNRKPCTDCYP